MKKSDMIKLIEEAMQHGPAYVLEKMLKAGMVPPTIEFMMGETKVKDNCWEKEDVN